MSFITRYLTPAFFLRLGLGVMYVWSGFDLVNNPDSWSWAVRDLPDGLEALITQFGVNNFLFLQGALELLFGLVLLGWFVPGKIVGIVAALSAAEMIAIVWLVGIDLVTFRDLGLVGASLALTTMYLGSRYATK